MTQTDDHGPEGLAADLPHLTRRRLLVTGLAMGGAAVSLWAARGGAQTVTGIGADGSACVAIPAETAGPFPADGTNVRAGQVVNILTEAGVIREDIRPSIAGLAPRAEGIGLTLDLPVALRCPGGLFDLRGCGPQLPARRRHQRCPGPGAVHHGLPGLLSGPLAASAFRGLCQCRSRGVRRAGAPDIAIRFARSTVRCGLHRGRALCGQRRSSGQTGPVEGWRLSQRIGGRTGRAGSCVGGGCQSRLCRAGDGGAGVSQGWASCPSDARDVQVSPLFVWALA